MIKWYRFLFINYLMLVPVGHRTAVLPQAPVDGSSARSHHLHSAHVHSLQPLPGRRAFCAETLLVCEYCEFNLFYQGALNIALITLLLRGGIYIETVLCSTYKAQNSQNFVKIFILKKTNNILYGSSIIMFINIFILFLSPLPLF